MAYVGNPIDTQNTFQSLVGKRFSGDGSTTAFTLDVAPSSVLDIEVFVGNVRQDPNSAYTLSGTTLTFTGAPPSGTNNIYVVHQAKSVGTIDVPAGGVQAGSLATGVLTGQTDIGGAIADADLFLVDDGAGGTLRKTAASRIKTYVGGFDVSSITGATALTETPAGTDEFVFSDAGTLKRVDFSLMNNSPIFYAHNQNSQTISNNTHTVVQFDTDSATGDFDPDSKFNTSNYRFTPAISGYYLLYTQIALYDNNDFDNFRCTIRKNGSAIVRARIVHKDNGTINAMTIVNSDTDDYFDCEVYHDKGSNLSLTTGYENTYFTGFKVV